MHVSQNAKKLHGITDKIVVKVNAKEYDCQLYLCANLYSNEF